MLKEYPRETFCITAGTKDAESTQITETTSVMEHKVTERAV